MQPNRLLDEGATDFERWVLETAQSEQPDAELDKRMMAALTGAAVGTGATALATSSGTAKAWQLGKWGLVKWGAGVVGVTSVALTALVSSGVGLDTREPTAHVVEAKPSVALAPPTGTESGPAPTPEAAEKDAAAPSAPAPAAPRASTKPVDPLKDELELLQRARAALAARRPAAALTVLAQYERLHPRGQLSQEATVLRVQALEARGKQEQADRLADDFLEKNPTSAHAPQIERARAAP